MTRHIREHVLNEFVEGTLPVDKAEEVRRHLAECSECDAEEKQIRKLLDEIRDLPTGLPGSDLWSGLSKELGLSAESEEEATEDVSDDFLETLAEMIALRHMQSSYDLINEHFHQIVKLGPGNRNAAPLLGYFARWLQMGFANKPVVEEERWVDILKDAVKRFPRAPRPNVTVRDVAHLRMVEGFLSLHASDFAEAIRHFQFVIGLDPELGDQDQIATAYFSIAKACRRQGAYDDALKYANLAIGVAQSANRVEMAAGFSVMLGWLLFQQGDPKQARDVLQESEEALRDSDDFLRLGNIQSAFGRLVQREGKYWDALEYFERALELFRKWREEHSNVARTLVNIAFVKILVAQRADKKSIMSLPEVPTKGPRRPIASLRQGAETMTGPEELRKEAAEHLARADRIYKTQKNLRGLGSVQLTQSLLCLSRDDY
jgi:tetratricopeptide (TPR) repeat protein